jgi:hypothetical protein
MIDPLSWCEQVAMTGNETSNSSWRAPITKDGVTVAKEIELENRSERPTGRPIERPIGVPLEPAEDEIVRGVD